MVFVVKSDILVPLTTNFSPAHLQTAFVELKVVKPMAESNQHRHTGVFSYSG